MNRRTFIRSSLAIAAAGLASGCATQREWAANKIWPAAGLTIDMIELNTTAREFGEIYRPFYDEVKAAGLDFTDPERETLNRAHNSLITVKGYIQAIHDSATNPRQALVKIDQLERMVEPIVAAVNDARPILDKKRKMLSVENQGRLDAGLALFDQAAEQARSIANSEDAQEAQSRIKTLLTVGATIIKIAALA